MSTGAEPTIIGELSNNGMTYHLPNPVMTNEATNYTIARQWVYLIGDVSAQDTWMQQ
jgi:hypothetical protein